MPFGGVKVVLAGGFGQLPPVAVRDERTLLHGTVQSTGKDSMEVNLGARLFRDISNVFRLRRMDGWMDGRMDGWMDGRTDGRTDR